MLVQTAMDDSIELLIRLMGPP